MNTKQSKNNNLKRNIYQFKGNLKLANFNTKSDKQNLPDYPKRDKSKSASKNHTPNPLQSNVPNQKIPLKKKCSNNKTTQIIDTENRKLKTQGNAICNTKRPDIFRKQIFNATLHNGKQQKIEFKKQVGDNNYFITADVSSVLRVLNKSKGQMNNCRKTQKKANMMTEQDIQKLFQRECSSGKKKYSQNKNKQNEQRMNKKDKKYSQIDEDIYQNKLKLKIQQKIKQNRKNLITEPVQKQNGNNYGTFKFNIKQILQNQPNDIIKKETKDFAQSIKYLQLIQQSEDVLLSALVNNDLVKIQQDPNIDKTAKFKQQFIVGKQIGQGAYASVRLAFYKPQNQKVAIKIYEKKKIKQIQRRKSVRRQIKILQRIDHESIMKIYDVIQTNNHVNIIMQYIQGISLNQYLRAQPNSKISQKNAKKIFVPLVNALKYLHQNSICHRDIKLENVLLIQKDNQQKIIPKLIDFGFSTCIHNQKKIRMFCGTPSYMAPQIVLKKQYKGTIADVWALGVLLYVMLSGVFPFKGTTDKQLYNKISTSDYPKIAGLSKNAQSILQKMLTIQPEKRITAQQILQQQWITSSFINADRGDSLIKTKQKRQTIFEQSGYKLQNTLINKPTNITMNNNKYLRKLNDINGCSYSKQKKSSNLTQTQKQQQLKYEIKKLNNNNQIQFSPRLLRPKTCTNRQSKQIKFNENIKQQIEKKPSSKLLQFLKKQMKKKQDQNQYQNQRTISGKKSQKSNQPVQVQQKLTNKRYF